MGLQTITFNCTPGSYSVSHSSLSYSTMLKVKREGMNYNIIVSGTPSSNQVLYTASSGTLTFSFPFVGIGVSLGSVDTNIEKVYVLYK